MNKIQAKAPDPIPFGKEAFSPQAGTTVRWLGGAGALVNCRGTNILIDPVLEGFDMPLLVESPLRVEDVPQVDAVLLTHSDNDHFSRDTCRDLAPVCGAYHAPRYVAGLCQDMGLSGVGQGGGTGVFARGLLRLLAGYPGRFPLGGGRLPPAGGTPAHAHPGLDAL